MKKMNGFVLLDGELGNLPDSLNVYRTVGFIVDDIIDDNEMNQEEIESSRLYKCTFEVDCDFERNAMLSSEKVLIGGLIELPIKFLQGEISGIIHYAEGNKYKIKSSYDSKGLPMDSTFTKDGEIISECKWYDYNDKGQLIEREVEHSDCQIGTHNYIYEYYRDGKLKRVLGQTPSYDNKYYDRKGNIVYREYGIQGRNYWNKYKNIYDSQDRLIRREWTDYCGRSEIWEYWYDPETGVLILETLNGEEII